MAFAGSLSLNIIEPDYLEMGEEIGEGASAGKKIK